MASSASAGQSSTIENPQQLLRECGAEAVLVARNIAEFRSETLRNLEIQWPSIANDFRTEPRWEMPLLRLIYEDSDRLHSASRRKLAGNLLFSASNNKRTSQKGSTAKSSSNPKSHVIHVGESSEEAEKAAAAAEDTQTSSVSSSSAEAIPSHHGKDWYALGTRAVIDAMTDLQNLVSFHSQNLKLYPGVYTGTRWGHSTFIYWYAPWFTGNHLTQVEAKRAKNADTTAQEKLSKISSAKHENGTWLAEHMEVPPLPLRRFWFTVLLKRSFAEDSCNAGTLRPWHGSNESKVRSEHTATAGRLAAPSTAEAGTLPVMSTLWYYDHPEAAVTASSSSSSSSSSGGVSNDATSSRAGQPAPTPGGKTGLPVLAAVAEDSKISKESAASMQLPLTELFERYKARHGRVAVYLTWMRHMPALRGLVPTPSSSSSSSSSSLPSPPPS